MAAEPSASDGEITSAIDTDEDVEDISHVDGGDNDEDDDGDDFEHRREHIFDGPTSYLPPENENIIDGITAAAASASSSSSPAMRGKTSNSSNDSSRTRHGSYRSINTNDHQSHRSSTGSTKSTRKSSNMNHHKMMMDGALTLRKVAAKACKRIDIGTAVLPQPLFTPDPMDYNGMEELRDAARSVSTRYARTIEREFNAIVVEHHLKWSPLCISEPGPLLDKVPSERLGRYDFHYADSIVDWALERDMKVKGHVLVWHVTSPNHILESLEPHQVREELRRHIFTVMGHYRGRIDTWDVVNEALAPDGTLADTVFLRKLGPSYIADCFRWAHEADPSVKLLYNDNKVEGIGNAKADAFYALVADLKSQNVPIHGCGMQGHFNAAGTGRNRPPTPRQVKAQIHRIGQLGLSVNISEMDVRVSQVENAEIRAYAQEQIYRDIVAAALSEPACDGIWLWGFTDRHTWVTHFYYDDEPLILDENYEKKPAYYGLRDALSTLVPGGTVGGSNGRDHFLESDYDDQGNAWGYEWIAPEASLLVSPDEMNEAPSGDANPDWQQQTNIDINNKHVAIHPTSDLLLMPADTSVQSVLPTDLLSMPTPTSTDLMTMQLDPPALSAPADFLA
jgi:endo-1,4-beta-xylanase